MEYRERPDFFFQIGHQDQRRCLEMLRAGFGDGVIFSPRHLPRERLMMQYAGQYREAEAEVLVDPQLYAADPGTPELAGGAEREELLIRLLDVQRRAGVTAYLVPVPIPEAGITDWWVDLVHEFASAARTWVRAAGANSRLLCTLPIPEAVLSSFPDRVRLLEAVVGLDVDGFYVLAEGPLLDEEPQRVAGVLDIIFRLKQNLFYVLLGYSSYLAMLAFPLGLDGFASGGHDNTRHFLATHWALRERREMRPPPTKYWSTRLLGRIVFPDEALEIRRGGLWTGLDEGSPFAAALFEGPGLVDAAVARWRRTDSFQHYLWTCWRLCQDLAAVTLPDRPGAVRRVLMASMGLNSRMEREGVLLRRESQPRHVARWLDTFDSYLGEVMAELEDEFE